MLERGGSVGATPPAELLGAAGVGSDPGASVAAGGALRSREGQVAFRGGGRGLRCPAVAAAYRGAPLCRR